MTESGMADRLPAVEFGRTSFTADEARQIGTEIGIDWTSAPFDVEQFRMGMDVELEHGLRDPATDVMGSDAVITGKIALPAAFLSSMAVRPVPWNARSYCSRW